MKNLSILALFSVFLISCGESAPTETPQDTQTSQQTDTVANTAEVIVDTVATTLPNEELMGIMPLFIGEQTLPFNPGEWEGEWEALEEMEPLRTNDVRVLSANMLESDYNSSVLWDLESFYMLDSLIENDLYDAYVETIDIGMMMYSDARALYNHKINDNIQVLTWTVNYSTYEACPYAAGTICVATVVKDGNVTASTLLNEQMSAGDPPVGMSRTLLGLLSEDGTIQLDYIGTETDEDMETGEEIVDKTEHSYSLKIEEDGSITQL